MNKFEMMPLDVFKVNLPLMQRMENLVFIERQRTCLCKFFKLRCFDDVVYQLHQAVIKLIDAGILSKLASFLLARLHLFVFNVPF